MLKETHRKRRKATRNEKDASNEELCGKNARTQSIRMKPADWLLKDLICLLNKAFFVPYFHIMDSMPACQFSLSPSILTQGQLFRPIPHILVTNVDLHTRVVFFARIISGPNLLPSLSSPTSFSNRTIFHVSWRTWELFGPFVGALSPKTPIFAPLFSHRVSHCMLLRIVRPKTYKFRLPSCGDAKQTTWYCDERRCIFIPNINHGRQ